MQLWCVVAHICGYCPSLSKASVVAANDTLESCSVNALVTQIIALFCFVDSDSDFHACLGLSFRQDFDSEIKSEGESWWNNKGKLQN